MTRPPKEISLNEESPPVPSNPPPPPPPPYKDDPPAKPYATTTVTTTTTTTTTTQTHTHHVFPSLSLSLPPLWRRKSISKASPSRSNTSTPPLSTVPVPVSQRTVSSPVTFPSSRTSSTSTRPSFDRQHLLTKPLPPPPESTDSSPSSSFPSEYTPSTPAIGGLTPSVTLTPSSPPLVQSAGRSEHIPALSPPSTTPTSYLAHASLIPVFGLGLPTPLPPPPTLSPTSVLEPIPAPTASSLQKRFSMRRARSFERPPAASSSTGPQSKAGPSPRRPRTATSEVPPPLPQARTPSATLSRKPSLSSRASLWSRNRAQTSLPTASPPAPSSSPPPHVNYIPSTPGRSPMPLQPTALLPAFTTPSSPLEKAPKRRSSTGLLSFALSSREAPAQEPLEGIHEVRPTSTGLRSPAQIGSPAAPKPAQDEYLLDQPSGSPSDQIEMSHPGEEFTSTRPHRQLSSEGQRPARPRSATLDSLASLATSFPWTRNSLILSPSLTNQFSFADPATPAPNTGFITASASTPPSVPIRRATASANTPPAPVRQTSLSRLTSSGRRTPSLSLLPKVQETTTVGTDVGGRDVSEEEKRMGLELDRLVRTVNRTDLASVLCGTPLLALHLSRLKPTPFPHPTAASPGLPLDVSLRLLLMHLALPRETQAIDKVIETFAVTWARQYPGLVTSDQAYILAFSIIMLHTDHFNKSNRKKMSREDYVKNTKRGGGLSDVVLEYFYDNITFAPFIFIEDLMDVNGQQGFFPAPDAASPGGLGISGASKEKKGRRVDLYLLITQGRLDPLRAQLDPYVPTRDPFSYMAADLGGLRVEDCHCAFAEASEVRVRLSADNAAARLPGLSQFAPVAPAGNIMEGRAEDGEMFLRLTKVGVLMRKEDMSEGGKKASSRKWREWGVAIAGSQLLFFKEASWIIALKQMADAARDSGGPSPLLADFKPDEWVSLKDAVALRDASYAKYDNVLRLALSRGRQYLIQAASAADLDEWLLLINYAASFKTAGVRMRSAGMTSGQLGLAALAAAESHVRDVKFSMGTDNDTSAGKGSPLRSYLALGQSPSTSIREPLSDLSEEPPFGVPLSSAEVLVLSPSSSYLPDPADQLEATFNEIKAELAASATGMAQLGLGASPSALGRRGAAMRASSLGMGFPGDTKRDIPRSHSVGSLLSTGSPGSFEELDAGKGWLASRSEVIQRKINQFDEQIRTMKPHLDTDFRNARNLAILTPFQRSTRDRLQAAVEPLAKRIKQLRIELARIRCHRDVLTADLDQEKKGWAEARRVAFDTAEARLGGRGRPLKVEVPRMTLSMHLESPHEVDLTDSVDGYVLSQGRPSSSTNGSSYHSAIETPDLPWPSPDDSRPMSYPPKTLFRSRSTLVGSSRVSSEVPSTTMTEEATPDTSPSSYFPFPPHQSDTDPKGSLSVSQNSTGGDPAPPMSPEEEPPEWDVSRWGKRASLVQLPLSGLHPRSLRAATTEADRNVATPDKALPSSKYRERTLSQSP